MTIHGSGTPIYASEIQAEFGGGNPFYISNYYAGGPYVPAGTVGQFGAIPSSGAISLWHFYGASSYQFTGNLVAGTNQAWRGFWYDNSMGTLTPTAALGTDIRACMWNTNGSFHFYLWANIGNQGFDRLIINGSFVLYRSSASYSTFAGGSAWTWGGTSNPFTTGANHTLNLA